MFTFGKFFTLVSATGLVYAAAVHDSIAIHHCSDAKLVTSTTIDVGGARLEYTKHSCASESNKRRPLSSLCGVSDLCSERLPQAASVNVCGQLCTLSCDDVDGVLPPISEDCQMIKNAVQILESHVSPLRVEPDHITAVTFGTCAYSFQNNGYEPLEYCWSDLIDQASEAGSACFPPVQPFSSRGLCSSTDGSWCVGVGHS